MLLPAQHRLPTHVITRLGVGALLGLAILFAGCGSSTATVGAGTPTQVPCPSTTSLSGAGSTFDNPLFTKMFQSYSSATCTVQVTYNSVGSGAGISQLLAGTVDFGATDAPMTDAQLATSTKGAIIHIPVTIGAVAISYNLPGLTTPVQLTGDTLANIFLGTVKMWNDPAIAATNSGVTLPAQAIIVVHRSDGSGTTGILSHYLSAVSPTWMSKVGAGSTLNWPVGVGAKGNAAVAAAVKATKYSIGYNELDYVLANQIQYASVQNADKSAFLAPSVAGVQAAASSATSIPADLRFYIVNEPGAQSYPISGYSWVVVYQSQTNADKGQALANTLWWMVHQGQQYSAAIYYVALSPSIVSKDEAQIKSMTCGGSSCYKGLFG
jgi:phosphate transport system substrate-binding protein